LKSKSCTDSNPSRAFLEETFGGLSEWKQKLTLKFMLAYCLKLKEPPVKPVPTREGEVRNQMALKGRARLGIDHPLYKKILALLVGQRKNRIFHTINTCPG
jgi:hypothetical protein